jgi:DNA polymerase-3 subunit beta
MKFTCERNAILKEISIAQEIISSKNVLSILSNVLLNASDNTLTIKATDLKISFETLIPVEVSIPGTTTVFCDKLLGILKALPSVEIEFELVDNAILNIHPLFNKIDFKLRSISADKFPELQTITDNHLTDFPQKDFIEMISKTIFAVSSDETRYFMNGVYIEKNDNKLNMVATDGKRLSYIYKEMSSPTNDITNAIIPPKILHITKKLLPGEGNLAFCVTDKNIFVKFGNISLSSNLIDGQFPNYLRVIPENQEQRVIVKKELLETAIKRVSLLVEQKSRRIFFNIKKDLLSITSEESEIGMAQEEVVCAYDGPETVITLNYLCILEPLLEMSQEEVSIEFTDSNKAITLKSVPEEDFLHIVMPMQAK